MMNNTTIRAILYFIIPFLAAASGWLADAPDDPTWKQWAMLSVGCLVAGFTGFRAYIDGSAEREKVSRAQPSVPRMPVQIGVVLVSALLLTGCTNAFQKSIQTSSIVAEGALSGWRVYEQQADPPLAQSLKVVTVADRYYLAEDLALVSYAQWHAAKSGDKKQVEAAVDGLAEAAGTLVEVVESFMKE